MNNKEEERVDIPYVILYGADDQVYLFNENTKEIVAKGTGVDPDKFELACLAYAKGWELAHELFIKSIIT